MINKYLNYVSQKKSQIIIFILFNLCGLAFILLPYGIVWNMLDLNLSYTSADVFKSFYQMGENGRYINLYSTLILDMIYPILYASLILGAYVKLFKNNNLILFIPTTAFLLDVTENINIAYMNINYLDLNETQVMLGSMVTSIKWLTITTMILVLVFGYLKKK
ncbi:hypothetical protein N9C52_00505 [Pelagibacterales bacterium]|nr:hypothetical protein [Pelagibacterales bacterium]